MDLPRIVRSAKGWKFVLPDSLKVLIFIKCADVNVEDWRYDDQLSVQGKILEGLDCEKPNTIIAYVVYCSLASTRRWF